MGMLLAASRFWNEILDASITLRNIKCDDSLESFIFTLNDSLNTAARKFVLKADSNHDAIQGHH
jgi:hypothetical protein